MKLSDLPLWRLLVCLDDIERTAGPDSETAKALSRIILARLRGRKTSPADDLLCDDGPLLDAQTGLPISQ